MSPLLQGGLPLAIEGEAIYPSFRNMVRLEQLVQDKTLPPEVKLPLAVRLLYQKPQQNLQKALDGLVWFYACGQPPKTARQTNVPQPPAYSFEKDAALIYAAFYGSYGINLATVPFLHWWEFCALLAALPETTHFMQVVGYRTAQPENLPPHQRDFYKKMQHKYRLAQPQGQPPSLHTRESQMKQWALERFRAAERSQKNGL